MPPLPYAVARGQHDAPARGLAAIVPLPAVSAHLTTLRLVAVIDHMSPLNEEGAALVAAFQLAA